MKKARRKILVEKAVALFMLIVLCVGSADPYMYVSAEALPKSNLTTEYLVKLNTSIELYDTLLLKMKSDKQYSDSYAGVYIDEDGNLVIGVTEGTALEEYKTVLNDQLIQSILHKNEIGNSSSSRSNINISTSNLVQYKTMKYSYAEIYDVHMLLGSVMHEYEIIETRLSDRDNKLYVLLRNERMQQDILEFVEGAGHSTEFIVFEYSNSNIELTSTLYANTQIASAGNGTIGFAARYNGTYGFVTAGHVVINQGQYVYTYDGGSAQATYVSNSGYVDAAFVPIPSKYSDVSSSIMYNGSLRSVTGTASVIQGAAVTRYGAVTGRTYATITYSSVNHLSESGIQYYDMFVSDYTFSKGDSGGPIVSGNYLIGIIHGMLEESNVIGYGCKYTNIANTGISFVTSS